MLNLFRFFFPKNDAQQATQSFIAINDESGQDMSCHVIDEQPYSVASHISLESVIAALQWTESDKRELSSFERDCMVYFAEASLSPDSAGDLTKIPFDQALAIAMGIAQNSHRHRNLHCPFRDSRLTRAYENEFARLDRISVEQQQELSAYFLLEAEERAAYYELDSLEDPGATRDADASEEALMQSIETARQNMGRRFNAVLAFRQKTRLAADLYAAEHFCDGDRSELHKLLRSICADEDWLYQQRRLAWNSVAQKAGQPLASVAHDDMALEGY